MKLHSKLAPIMMAASVWGIQAASAANNYLLSNEVNLVAEVAAYSASKGWSDEQSPSIEGVLAKYLWNDLEINDQYEYSVPEPKPLTVNSKNVKLTLDQERLLSKAKDVGETIGLPETLQAILMQETLAGKLGRVGWGEYAFGITQVKPKTAQYITKKHKTNLELEEKATFEDYKQALLSDDDYSLKLTAAYIDMIHTSTKGNWKRTVVSYYQGRAGARKLSDDQIEDHFYLEGIRNQLKVVREYNQLKENQLAQSDSIQLSSLSYNP